VIVGRTRTPRLRHGQAGLLMALFVVAGLIFSYGLGHGPPPQICTTQLISVPVDEAAHTPGPDAPAARPGTAEAPAVPGHSFFAFTEPWDGSPLSTADTCLCLAVLLGLLALVLAARPRRTGGRTPPRSGWALVPPSIRISFGPSLSALRVLRL
jgi:hypothetical protein